jgi:transcriptional regulator with XRE-family HTH domain
VRTPHVYSPVAKEAANLLGNRIRLARLERRWTLAELAERSGASVVTLRKVERGDLTVGLGIAFEAAAVLGVALFHRDAGRRQLEADRVADALALMPEAVRTPGSFDDDF